MAIDEDVPPLTQPSQVENEVPPLEPSQEENEAPIEIVAREIRKMKWLQKLKADTEKARSEK